MRNSTHNTQATWLPAAIDGIVLATVATLVLALRENHAPGPSLLNEAVLFGLSIVAALIFFLEFGLFDRLLRASAASQAMAVGKGMLWVGILEAVAIFLIKDREILDYNRGNVLLFVFGGWGGVALVRLLVVRTFVARYLRVHDATRRRVAIVGAGAAGRQVAGRILGRNDHDLALDCFLDDDPSKEGLRLLGRPIAGDVDAIARLVHERSIEEIVVAISNVSYGRLIEIIAACRATGLPVTVAASQFRIVHDRIGESVLPLVDGVMLRPIHGRRLLGVVKRAIDIAGALLLITLLLPLLVGIALWIVLDDRGPVFYRAEVVGRNGRRFTWFKFRTMIVHRVEEVHREHVARIIRENGGTKKLENDRRITRAGAFLRRYSLDELPQLWSVLRGDMSLIGPRPCLPYEYDQLDEWHRRRFAVTPGLTGLWQVTGRNRSDVTFNDAVILDLYYIENQSLWLDFTILFKTIPVVLLGRGGA